MLQKIRIGDVFNIEKWSLQSSKNSPWEYDFITASNDRKTHNSFTHNAEALVFAMAASWSLWRTHYVNWKFIASDLCFILLPKEPNKINMQFYHVYFNLIRENIVKETATWSACNKIAINKNNFSNFEIIHCEIEKQDLIFEKINILQPLINEYLNLTQNNDLIKSLRQSILSYAIQGKLVPQDPTDEPASELLKKIQAEKEQLIAEKKIKKPKPLAPIGKDEKLFVLPNGWEWVRLGDICTKITDGFHNTPPKMTEWWFPYIAATQVNDWWIDRNTWSFVEEKYHRELYNKAYPKKWEILVVNIWAWCWSPAIIDIDYEFSFKNTAILKFNQIYIYNRYLLFFLLLSKSRFYNELTQWWAQPFLSLTILSNILFPLPPLAEQHRIVAKVNELMQLCDQLESRVADAQQQGKLLMESVLSEVMG